MSIITDNLTFDLLSILITLVVLTVAYLKWKLTYWDRVGLPTLNPSLPFGDTKDLILGKGHIGETFQDFYKIFKSKGLKHGGVYFGMQPIYIPVDPTIIKHILQNDFSHFVNRDSYVNEKADPLGAHLGALQDAKWRNMRAKLTPTFTSGRMKMMFQTLVDCTDGLKTIMNDAADRKTSVEIKDVLGRFTTDIIGSTAFGLECNSLKNPNSEFRIYGKMVLEGTVLQRIKVLLQFVLPKSILRLIGFKITRSDVEAFFMKTVKDTVAYREDNNIYRKDFMHLLLQLKNRGSVADDDKISDEGKFQEKALTMNELAAQAFVFFIAGFETSSTTMTFALLELAMNPDIQDNLREEINTVLAKYDGKITYDAIMEMTYLDKVVNETLRKHSPAATLSRKCTKDYTVPESNISLKKGVAVFISVYGLHRDPEYYPNPEIFDPERFSEENKKTRPPFTWLPFGDGPRNCIGLRFGLMQSKVGLATLLKNYRISLSERTKIPISYDKYSIVTSVDGGVWLDVTKLN